ncbi:Protein kinase [Melia azedarach]|uniref:Protein kinase n=2 Tax=Melia azedarach TaxID=155640 RepID=A0ACC1X8M2_MELAZ|nr:Protein kinase [Melia azedarach]
MSSTDGPPPIFVATMSVMLGVVVLSVVFSIIRYACEYLTPPQTENQNPASANEAAEQRGVDVIWEAGQTMERFLQEIQRDKPVRFTSQRLKNFTTNYKTRLGFGGFGEVFQGQFPNGVKIAVKVLNRNLGRIAEEQFMAEVGTIGRTYHINLVRLYGFCHDQHMTALVYEFMENGSLDKYLFNKMRSIEWEKLHEIAIGTAKGLAYLHEECQQRIIHYDIKPENVLLDVNFSPRVADFGLAKLCDRNRTHVTISGYKGTPGYSAPEFLSGNYPITHKCDVYSFGMVLFEIVGRRRNAIVGASETLDWFPKHVWEEYDKGESAAMISGACGIEEKNREKAKRTCMVALWCVQDSPEARPPMSAVVKMLEGTVEVLPPPKPFRYLDIIRMTALRSADSSDGSGFSSESRWYKETTPIMAKHDIQMATC